MTSDGHGFATRVDVDSADIVQLMITSIRNPKVQQVRRLFSRSKNRREEQAFVIEGVRLIEESRLARIKPMFVLFTKTLSARGEHLIAMLEKDGVEMHEVSQDVMQAVSDTQSPQGLLVVLPIQEQPIPEVDDLLLILDNVRDPGNAGTILRTASAAGVTSVIFTPGCVDVYAPKVVRAAMGAHFRLSIRTRSWQCVGEELEPACRKGGLKLHLADAREGELYTQIDYRGPTGIIVGGEAQGAGPEALELMDNRVHIPMASDTESLNVGTAAAVLLYEVLRQRTSNQIG